MTVYRVPASLLHQIEQELDAEEKEAMVFLCRDLVPDLPGTDVRNLLVALNEREMLTHFTLAELLYRLKRFDLLKKMLATGRAAVEANLDRHPPMVSKYRVLMTEISEDLDKDDLRSLVFLLMNDLGASHVKKTKEKSFLTIINELEKLDLVSPNQLDLIENCFLHIHRKDLAKKIQKYKWEALVHPVDIPSVYANTLQASFPKLSLADPPVIMNKGMLLNRACAVKAEPVHISIPETGGAAVQVISKYRMQSQPLGVCLIIDCIGNDAGMLADTFRALHFEVRCHLFLNVGSMMRELNDVARLREHKVYDCFVCILVSRGNHQHIFCTDHVVPGFSLERVKHYFVGDRCPDLLGKPKLFFIQNYVEASNWQHNTSLVEADGDLCTIPQVADVLWSQSTLDASALERSPNSSSYYLTALAELLIDPRKRNLPLLDILVELSNRVYERNRTNPAEQYSLVLKHTLRKKLFLSDS
ncbi:CASP8 and FADD-like apoptosis regulator [Sceloporus undulatus]|uniref:CASP8 and FADD-like apoptosis regulator n=1 Tax=Sceloporus undulatus TaxID=8520 RepID=UPI001C4B7932|nr:CASP8 and FADD-like apoptosis regulator [Sceloporus undulatus]XP_042331470.1 CASP8 and FADD-like apoptosis regulator [Sceloporus undulatus]XP_042331478.1 CASP8 and FADD-like apoptosis regulator [Sceloporus undulatus]